MTVVQVMRDGWLQDELQPRVDRLYADFTLSSHLLPVEHPWRFKVGDIVRVGYARPDPWAPDEEPRVLNEAVQIVDGFLHVRRAIGSGLRACAPAGSPVLIIASAYDGGRL